MTTGGKVDGWTAGEAYEAFMGRWSRRLAEAFVVWLAPEPERAWLDVGCGTGALASAICRHADPSRVVGCDPSPAFVEEARRRNGDPRVAFVTGDADALPEGRFDHVVSCLVLNFVPDPRRAAGAMRARTRSGGRVAACVWDYAGGMEFLRRFWDEAVAMDPGARDLDEGVRFPMCHPRDLESIFRDAGLRDVGSESIAIPTRFVSFADYWNPFLGGTGPAPSYVASLGDDRRTGLEERLRNRLDPERTGKAIDLVARAWAVRGSAP